MDKTENPFSRIIATADSQQELVNGISRELLGIVESFGFRKQCFAMQIADSAPTTFMIFWEHVFTCVVRQCMALHAIKGLDDERLPTDMLGDEDDQKVLRRRILADHLADLDRAEAQAVDGFHLLISRCLEFTRMAMAAPATEHNKNIFQLSVNCFEQLADNRERLLSFYNNVDSFCFHPTPHTLHLLLFSVSQSVLETDRFTESVALLIDSLSPSLPFYAKGMESMADWLTEGAPLVADAQAVATIPVACSAAHGSELPPPSASAFSPSVAQPKAQAQPSAVSTSSSAAVAQGARGVAPRLLEADAERCWRALVSNHYCCREADRYRWTASTREYGFMVELVSERLGFYSPDGTQHLLWREFAVLFDLDAQVNSAQTQLGRFHKGKPSDKAVQEMRKLKGIL